MDIDAEYLEQHDVLYAIRKKSINYELTLDVVIYLVVFIYE